MAGSRLFPGPERVRFLPLEPRKGVTPRPGLSVAADVVLNHVSPVDADVILRLKAYGMGDVETFPFIGPPAPKAVRAASGELSLFPTGLEHRR